MAFSAAMYAQASQRDGQVETKGQPFLDVVVVVERGGRCESETILKTA